uniref:Uncharacterized protein n=1 Tax=Anguilla anguilla TaxID=7936 RepID=A0A0E9XQN1_ANGAN
MHNRVICKKTSAEMCDSIEFTFTGAKAC